MMSSNNKHTKRNDNIVVMRDDMFAQTGGCIMQFFSSTRATAPENSQITIELLNLVAAVIGSPKCIFVRKKKYIDFYIRCVLSIVVVVFVGCLTNERLMCDCL
jgi:hypothetical protein